MHDIMKEKLFNLGYILIPDEKQENLVNNDQLALFLTTCLSYGFVFDNASLKKLSSLSLTSIKELYDDALYLMRCAVGDNYHRIFYKNFPNMEGIDSTEYIVRAFIHYLTVEEDDYGYMYQEEKVLERLPFLEKVTPKTIKVVNINEAEKLLKEWFLNTFEGNKMIPYASLYFLREIMRYFGVGNIVPNDIPFKNNIALYFKLITEIVELKKTGDKLEKADVKFVKTATDLLRIYAVLSGFYPDLVDPYFYSVDRKTRRWIVSTLDNLAKDNPFIMDDIMLHKDYWKYAFKMLHIGDYATSFPHAYNLAKIVRNEKYRTFNSKLEKAIEDKDEKTVFKMFRIKPALFARRIDSLLRNEVFSSEKILNEFRNIAPSLSVSVLISIWNFYKADRKTNGKIRSLMYRYSTRYMVFNIDENRKELKKEIIDEIINIIENALVSIFASRERLDKVYVSPSLKNFTIPTNNANAVSGFRTLSFGSKIKLNPEDNGIIRFFTHWKNGKGRVDVDLSLELFNEEFDQVGSLSWHNLEGGKTFDSFHSGDITTAPEGASEFIDLNYIKARKFARYAIVCNTVYTRQNYIDIPECYSGVMFRQKKGKTGEVFEPATVETKFDLVQRATDMVCSLLVDLETLELIWLDIPVVNISNVATCEKSVLGCIIQNAILPRMTCYDLLKLHKGHISFEDNKEDATYIFDEEGSELFSPYRFDQIAKNWL